MSYDENHSLERKDNSTLMTLDINRDSDATRASRIPAALTYYTNTLGLTITPIHYPTAVVCDPESLRDAAGVIHPIRGYCSCTKAYTYLDDGTINKLSPDTLCSSPGKHPVKRGFADNPAAQATNPSAATALWEGHPYNIGVVTGKGTGLIVFDIDVRSDGLSSMSALDAALTAVESTWRPTSTFSYFTSGASDARGYHLYFRADPDDGDLWRTLVMMGENILPGVEVKWKRGIVVASPSLHPTGAVYELHNTDRVEELTQARLIDLKRALAHINGTPQAAASTGSSTLADLFSNQAAASRGLTWREAGSDADPDSEVNVSDGRWVRELEYLFMTGTPARTYPEHNHDRSLKRLFGALVNLFPPPDDIAEDMQKTLLDNQKTWIPPLYGELFKLVDEAVTKPKPWFETDIENFMGIAWYALVRHLEKQLAHMSWVNDRSR